MLPHQDPLKKGQCHMLPHQDPCRCAFDRSQAQELQDQRSSSAMEFRGLSGAALGTRRGRSVPSQGSQVPGAALGHKNPRHPQTHSPSCMVTEGDHTKWLGQSCKGSPRAAGLTFMDTHGQALWSL